MTASVLIMGASGHARAVAGVIRAAGNYRIIGLIDSFRPVGEIRFGFKVLGGEADIPRVLEEQGCERIAVAVGDNFQRARLWDRIQNAVPSALLTGEVHPSAVVDDDVEVGEGALIMPGAIVVSGARIGKGCVVNTGASFDHDSVMSDWSSLAPGVVTGGGVGIGERSFAGLGARIRQEVTVGADTVIGAGALVLNDLPEQVIAFGAPARIIRRRAPDEAYL